MAKKTFKMEIDAYCLSCPRYKDGNPVQMKGKQADKKTVNFKCPVCRRKFVVLIGEISIEGDSR